LNSVRRYKFLILNTYHPHTLIYVSKYVRTSGYFLKPKEGLRAKMFGKHWTGLDWTGLDSHQIMSLHFRRTCAERDNDETARVSNSISLSND